MVQRFDEPVSPIRVTENEQFAVALAGNPTTGYVWQAAVDADYVELLSQAFEREGDAVGAGGREVFYFRAHRAGETEITFESRRAWGGSPRIVKHCRLAILEGR